MRTTTKPLGRRVVVLFWFAGTPSFLSRVNPVRVTIFRRARPRVLRLFAHNSSLVFYSILQTTGFFFVFTRLELNLRQKNIPHASGQQDPDWLQRRPSFIVAPIGTAHSQERIERSLF